MGHSSDAAVRRRAWNAVVLDRGRQLANLSSAGSRHRTAAVSLRRWLHPFENQSNFFSGKKRSGKEEKNVKFLFTLGRIFEIAGRI